MTQTFAILPAGTRILWVLVPVFMLLLGGLALGAPPPPPPAGAMMVQNSE